MVSTGKMSMSKIEHFDPDEIRANLKTKRIGKKILVYKSTSSTNDVAAEYAKNKENDGLVILAEKQTVGRGRGGNKWYGGSTDSILCSIILNKSELSNDLLSLTCAVAVADAIGKLRAKQAKIKWPNDIMLNGKKVSGILLETKTNHGRVSHIIGIGINCHQKKESFPAEIQAIATSIDIESRTVCDRISLVRRVLTCMDQWLGIAERNPKEVTDQWRKLSIQLGHRVVLVFNGQKFAGNCIGVDPERGLTLQLDSGGVRMFNTAHTTIMK